jgi:GWxTD domain-containing protein
MNSILKVKFVNWCWLVLFFIAASSASSVAQENIPTGGFKDVKFSVELASFRLPTTTDSVRTDIYIAVPYSFLLFQNAVDKYIADYQVILEVRDPVTDSTVIRRQQSNSVVLPTTVWEKLKELDESRADASQVSLHLAAGKSYKIKIRVHDRTKNSELEQSFQPTTRSFASSAMTMSDILLYRSKVGNRLTPNIGEDISAISPLEGGVFFELYNAPQSAPLWVVNLITDSTGADISRIVSVAVPDGRAKLGVFTPLMGEDIWSGKYELHTCVVDNSSDTSLSLNDLLRKSLITASKKIVVGHGHGIPLTTNDLDESIDQLLQISYGGAYDSLTSAHTPAEKRQAIKDFWAKMNQYRGQTTTRPMEVFYRRVSYANAHFNQLGPGWRSDQGRLYIMLGEPTSIDRSSYDVGRRPYEAWTYYDLNQRFIFVDQFLIGDYRISGPLPPPGTFYWEREGQ